VLVTLFPWNPALWWQLRRLRLAVEMDCDQRVVASLGDAPAYGELLLRVARAASRGPALQPALVGRVGTLERRLTVLVAPAPRRLLERVVAPALALALLLLVLAVPHPRIAAAPRAPVAVAREHIAATPAPAPAPRLHPTPPPPRP